MKGFDDERPDGDFTLEKKDIHHSLQSTSKNMQEETRDEKPIPDGTTVNGYTIKCAVHEGNKKEYNGNSDAKGDEGNRTEYNDNSYIINEREIDTESMTTGELEFDDMLKDNVKKSLYETYNDRESDDCDLIQSIKSHSWEDG